MYGDAKPEPKASDRGMIAQDLRDVILAEPEAILEDTAVMAALVLAATALLVGATPAGASCALQIVLDDVIYEPVAPTGPIVLGAEVEERLGQVRAHEAVGARDADGAAAIDVAEVAAQALDVALRPDNVVRHGHYPPGE